jgi:hypothetical protein
MVKQEKEHEEEQRTLRMQRLEASKMVPYLPLRAVGVTCRKPVG